MKARICNYEKQRIQFEQCFFDSTITGFLGKFSPIPAEGISFNRAIGTLKDNNNYFQPESDQTNHLYIDAEVNIDHKSSEIDIASLPSAYFPTKLIYGLGALVWSDGSNTQGGIKITPDGKIKVSKDKKKTLERVVIDISYY